MRSNVFVAMLHFRVFIIYINCIVCIATLNNTKQVNNSDCGINNSCPVIPVDNLPRILCIDVAYDFLDCEQPLDLKGNKTAKEQLGYGCTKFGGQKYEDVEFTAVNCTVLNGIECNGNRTFMKEGFPCIKYSGHYFVTTLLYSILLGFLGMDRFCLGHTGTAVGKLLTLGGVGIWWIVDIVLLVTGHLMPEDGSNWMPYA